MERSLRNIFILLILIHLGVVAWILLQGYQSVYSSREPPPGERLYVIAEGATLVEVLKDLHARDLAPEPIYVRLALRIEGQQLLLKQGTYRLPARGSTMDFLRLFHEGKVLLERLTVPEGLDKWQVAELLGGTMWGDQARFMAIIEDPAPIAAFDPAATDLEGYLFPETYFFPQNATPREIIHTMVRHFLERTTALRENLHQRGLSLRDWVALASLVQEESALTAEGPIIAGVFQNRLERDMRLECDPTIIYSLKLADIYRGKIYRSDIRRPHPYNTYVVKGLPPGPIASPGIAALEAAMNPADVPYIFFVAKPDGSHHFSETYREHRRAVREFLRR